MGQLKLKETGSKPKNGPPKPAKQQVTKHLSNPGLPIPGTSQAIPKDQQMTNVRGQFAVEQTSLKKKTKDVSGHDTSTEIDTEAQNAS